LANTSSHQDELEQLVAWGWDDGYATTFAALSPPAYALPARVVGQDRDRWAVRLAGGAGVARIAGASYAGAHPVAGDWVMVRAGPEPTDPLTLLAVLPRRSAVSRGAAGDAGTEQVLAANIDVVWIVHGLDTPVNARRLERYLAAAWESGAVPEVVLTKADLAPAAGAMVAEVEAVAIGVAVHVVSAARDDGVRALQALLRPGATYALLGPSGAGKSTLINALAGSALAVTGVVRELDRKGRHTTTRRELFRIAAGALLLDTPGLREFRVWAAEEALAQTFPEIDALAMSCRFRDCRHEVEPGCAVRAAAEAGALDPERVASWRKLRAEAAYMERRDDPQANAAAVAKHKTALKTLKYHPKYRDER
jgi:ribosome biogenesis GTPase / thiamine phosphate phosphatase